METQQVRQCACSNHIFRNPLCHDQTLIKKVANIAFHILTLCIPLIIYHTASYLVSRFSISRSNAPQPNAPQPNAPQPNAPQPNAPQPNAPQPNAPQPIIEVNEGLIQSLLENIPRDTPLTFVLRHAPPLLFRDLRNAPPLFFRDLRNIPPLLFRDLRKDPPDLFRHPLEQPTREIAQLMTIEDRQWHNFMECLEKYAVVDGELPRAWKEPEVIEVANCYIQICYAISVLTVKDLVKNCQDPIQKLSNQRSGHYKMLFVLPYVYQLLRRPILPIKRTGENGKPEYSSSRLCLKDSDQSHPFWSYVHGFYEEGTLQNTWRLLFNGYCQFVDRSLDRVQLEALDDRYTNWTKQDHQLIWKNGVDGIENPGTMPA